MSAVACRVEGEGPACLRERLAAALRRARPAGKKSDRRIVADDSKLVHGSKGVPGLERGVLPLLPEMPATLSALASAVCPADTEELGKEAWYSGRTALPVG